MERSLRSAGKRKLAAPLQLPAQDFVGFDEGVDDQPEIHLQRVNVERQERREPDQNGQNEQNNEQNNEQINEQNEQNEQSQQGNNDEQIIRANERGIEHEHINNEL